MSQESSTPAATTGPRQLVTTLRPQIYGKGSPNNVIDPIIEPLWVGVRALAAVDGDGAIMVDEAGVTIDGFEDILGSLTEALSASALIVDGYLTKQASQDASPVNAWSEEVPTMTSIVGLRRNRAVDTLKLREAALEARSFSVDDEITYVATDLLWLDETSLLDVPLLERRRLLESALLESEVVRIGAFIRPPIMSWVGSWKSQGFDGLTYKAANSRYHPGEARSEWAISGMPRR